MNLQWHDCLNLLGLGLGLAGAWYTAASPVLTEEDAIKMGVSRWGADTDAENLKLPAVQALLQQSRRSGRGLGLIAVGFLVQGFAILLAAK